MCLLVICLFSLGAGNNIYSNFCLFSNWVNFLFIVGVQDFFKYSEYMSLARHIIRKHLLFYGLFCLNEFMNQELSISREENNFISIR
jgi:hypothetical protein